MEKNIDHFLEGIFGGAGLHFANISFSLLLFFFGVFLLRSPRPKKAGGWILIGIGCMGILSGMLQTFF